MRDNTIKAFVINEDMILEFYEHNNRLCGAIRLPKEEDTVRFDTTSDAIAAAGLLNRDIGYDAAFWRDEYWAQKHN